MSRINMVTSGLNRHATIVRLVHALEKHRCATVAPGTPNALGSPTVRRLCRAMRLEARNELELEHRTSGLVDRRNSDPRDTAAAELHYRAVPDHHRHPRADGDWTE